MYKARFIIGVLGLTFLILGLSNCNVSKTNHSIYSLSQNPPFKISEGYYHDWIAGVQGGGSGTILFITFSELNKKVKVEDFFFRNKKVKAQNDQNNSLLYIGYFKNDINRGVIMDSDMNKEAQNIPPEKYPFQLEEDEAVISYTYKEVVQYYKVSNIIEEEVIAFPQTKPKND
ncbi:MAG: hypothetical protein DRI95_13335 [Bacteroidetes bacterium]|nr:MAG: hypothetical protein DRI95_13335 [Bacteroidota bacterium]